MTEYVTASFSGGKDSTAMVLHMIELGEQLDEVITCDTGMEFPAMYDHIGKVRAVVEAAGVKFTTIRAEHTFEWYMYEAEVKSEKYGDRTGLGWPTPVLRWCTKHLKERPISKYLSQLRRDHKVIQCVGLAADEMTRLSRPSNQRADHRHPLVEWGWSEADAMAYCRAKGYDWGGLYDKYNRVSCWCCPLQPISALRTLRADYPELWARLMDMDADLHTDGHYTNPYKGDRSMADLEDRFAREDKAAKEQTSLDSWTVTGGGE